jgi:ATP-dependent DNA helicase DinG
VFKVTTTYAVLDLETTGSTYDNGDRIIQIGVAFVRDGQIVGQFATDIFPYQDIPREITKLTGITTEQVKLAPPFEDIAADLWDMLADTVIVAHNIGFDYKFLDKSFQAQGFPAMTQDRVDTVEMIRTLYPTAESYKLSEFCQHHGIVLENAHTAVDDAMATAEVLLMCMAKIQQMPRELFDQLRLFAHYFIGQTGAYMAKWFDESTGYRQDYEYIAPFVLSEHQANFQIFPDKFGDKKAVRMHLATNKDNTSEQASIITSNNGVSLSTLQQSMVDEIGPFFHAPEDDSINPDANKFAFLTANAGVGKSLAYMMSALSAVEAEKTKQKQAGRVIVSTSTVILQHQFLDKTMSLATTLLGKPLKVVVLKGQRHFIQLTRFQKFLAYLKSHPEIALKRDVLISVAVLVWLGETQTGDLHELNSGLNNEVFWENMNRFSTESHHDEIQRWGDYAFYERHVREAKDADVVVLNHAYLVYHYQDLMVEGIMTDQSKVIIDECHQLPETVHQQATRSIQSKDVEDALTSIERLIHRIMDKVVTNHVKVHAVDQLFQVEKNLQVAWTGLDKFIDCLADEYQTKSYYQQKSQSNAYYISHEYYMIAKWREALRKSLKAMDKMVHPLKVIVGQLYHMDIYTKRIYQQLLNQINQFDYQLKTWLDASAAHPDYYAELAVHFGKQNTTVSIQSKLYSSKDQLAIIFNAIPSQTLLVSASIEIVGAKHIISKLFGIDHFQWFSFMEASYKQQLALSQPNQIKGYYINDFLSIDKYNEHQAAMMITDVIESVWANKHQVNKIQVFFQSRALLQAVQHELKRRFNRIVYGQVIVQNHQRNLDRLARQFEQSQRAILLALASFQEGIHLNTKTDAFIMTRLPFSAPDTPDELAKQDYLKSIGDQYFEDVALPNMLMNLTQIFGRMAATVNNESIFISLDHRLEKASYADQIQAIMPEALTMDWIDLKDLKNFDEQCDRM